MNLQEIKKLCAKKEGKNIEFKSSTANLRAAFETICAFLNTNGGTVLFGVRDDGKLLGQSVADKTKKEITTEIKKIEPSAPIAVNYIKLDDAKYVIVIQVEPGNHSPYVYDGRPYQRQESETHKMSQHHYEQLLVKRGQLNHSWEEFSAEGYNIDSLDHEEIYRTVVDGITQKRIPASIAKESVEKILKQLSLITDDGKIKQAAIVLFAKEIKFPYKQCWIKMARFKGEDVGGDFIDSQQEYCNVFRMLEVADQFLTRHLPIASYFKKDQYKRIDKFALPTVAVREALVNAMCHRAYDDKAGYISIAIFDNVVEIWSNGTLPKRLKLADLQKKHNSILRNKLIAEVFYFRGYVESWGTGIKKMIDSCKEHGIAAPKFSERTQGLVVQFKFAESKIVSTINKEYIYNPRQEKIIKLLKTGDSFSVANILEEIGAQVTLRTIKTDLFTLKKNGVAEQVGKARNSLWKISRK